MQFDSHHREFREMGSKRFNGSQTGSYSMKITAAAMAIAIVCAVPAGAQNANTRDSAETAVDDLHFIRATLRENHPGPVDRENQVFREWYLSGFPQALDRARRATDFTGYFFAISYYLAGFQDGHLGALTERHLEDRFT